VGCIVIEVWGSALAKKQVLVHFKLELTHVVTTDFILDTFVTQKKSLVGQLLGALSPIKLLGARAPIPPSPQSLCLCVLYGM